MVPKICFEGGPCSGKTTGQARLAESLAKTGFHPIVVPEAATFLMERNISPLTLSVADFQTAVIGFTKHMEDIAVRAAREYVNPVVLGDRGRASSRAYTDRDTYLRALRANGIGSHVEARDGYKGVFHMTTAADGAEAHYTLANNKHRRETPEQARALDARSRDAWIGAPHWDEVDNSTGFDEKIARLERKVLGLLGMPVPIERERKFLCEPLDRSKLPENAQDIDIQQIYLLSDDLEVTSRIRRRGQDGFHLYFRTDKKYLSPGENEEIERAISAHEYAALALERDLRKGIIHKTRTCFPYARQYLEFDVIPLRDGSAIHMLEIELTEDSATDVKIPDWIKVIKEVTDDPAYTNVRIAERV